MSIFISILLGAVVFVVLSLIFMVLLYFCDKAEKESKQEMHDSFVRCCKRNGIDPDMFDLNCTDAELYQKVNIVVKLKNQGYLKFDKDGKVVKVSNNKKEM